MKNLSKVSLITIALLSTSANAWFWDKNETPKTEVKEVSGGGELAALKARIAELEAKKPKTEQYTIVAKSGGHLKQILFDIKEKTTFEAISEVMGATIKTRRELREYIDIEAMPEGLFKSLMDRATALQEKKIDLNHIDVSKVRNMSEMFSGSKLNADISNWDVSSVTDMSEMFSDYKFNVDISKWDVSSVTNMINMFYNSQFNGDISKWDVSKVWGMDGLFAYSKFNGDISKWDVSSVVYMGGMFTESKFNGDISNWDVSNVTKMKGLFYKSHFNGDISKWAKKPEGYKK